MTEEELKAALAKAQDSIKALEAKNYDIIGKLKDAESAREEAAERAEREAKDIEALEKRLSTKYQKQIDELSDNLKARDDELRTIRVDNEVKSVIAASNVRHELMPAVEALMLRQASYEDGVGNINGKPIADFAKDFFASKEGSFYVNAPASSGSGSSGATVSQPKRMTKDTFNATEFIAYKQEHGVDAANALADEMEMPHLKGF